MNDYSHEPTTLPRRSGVGKAGTLAVALAVLAVVASTVAASVLFSTNIETPTDETTMYASGATSAGSGVVAVLLGIIARSTGKPRSRARRAGSAAILLGVTPGVFWLA